MDSKITAAESARLQELYSYNILDSNEEQEFNDIVALASRVAGTPISLISLVDKERQWFKARVGLAAPGTSREVSFCLHAIQSGQSSFIVKDATQDDRFMNNALVTGDPNIRFYAGFPLVTDTGHKLGSLCVIDSQPRTLSLQQIADLEILSRQAMKLMELRLRNQHLQQLKDQEARHRKVLERLLKNQRKIIAILAHDTRGPLFAIRQLLEMLKSSIIRPEDISRVYGMMEEHTTVTIDMIDSLVKWGEVHLRSVEEEQSGSSLSDIVDGVFRQYALAARAKQVNLKQSINNKTFLKANNEMMSFVIRNLVNNAIKYTESGNVTISGKRKGVIYELSVKDTGTGMSRQTKDSLFKGKNASQTGTRNEKGSGIGLMLIHDFVEQAGGTITVRSQVNKGTTFIVKIPVG